MARLKKNRVSIRRKGENLALAGTAQVEAEIAELERALSARKQYLNAIRLIESQGGRVVLRKSVPIRTARAARKSVKPRRVVRVRPAPPPAQEPVRLTWSDEMRRVLGLQTTGISYPDLLAEISKSALGTTRSKGDKGFYQAVKRLTESGEVVKNNGLLFSKELAEEMAKKGMPLPRRVVGRGGSGTIVLGILHDNPQGLSAPEIKEKAATHPEAPDSIRVHKHYIYNVLGNLVDDGLITRNEGKYQLAKAGNHPVH